MSIRIGVTQLAQMSLTIVKSRQRTRCSVHIGLVVHVGHKPDPKQVFSFGTMACAFKVLIL